MNNKNANALREWSARITEYTITASIFLIKKKKVLAF